MSSCGRLLGRDCTFSDLLGAEVARPEGTVDTSSNATRQPDTRPHLLCINNDQSVLGLFRDLLDDDGAGGYRVSTRGYIDHDLATLKVLEPDLIVLDYMWAEEGAGWTLLQMLRMDPRTASVPVVLCTPARCGRSRRCKATWRP